MGPEGDEDRDERATGLAQELGDVRQRGLADLDKRRSRQRPVAVPRLEELARRFGARQAIPQQGRIFLIQRLLDHALTTYATEHSEPEAAFLRRLFEDGRGNWPGPAGAGGLLDNARRTEGLDEDRFRDRQRGHLQAFAAFLLDRYDQTSEPPPRDTDAQTPPRRRALPVVLMAGAVLAASLVAVVLLLNRGDGSPTGSDPSISATSTAATDQARVQFRFDSLGSTESNVIQVYPGVTASDRDKTQNGTYYSGDTVQAVCITTGRSVSSLPAYGEQPRRSDQWVRIVGSPGAIQYATLTYGEVVPAGAKLPAC